MDTTTGISREERDALKHAPYAKLDHLANTDAAKALVEAIYTAVHEHERRSGDRQKGRRKTAADLKLALGAWIADLLIGRARDPVRGYVRRSKRNGAFTGERVTTRHFRTAANAFLGLKLMEVYLNGYWRAGSFGGADPMSQATVFRDTSELRRIADEHGVALADIRTHFVPVLPDQLLVLRERSKKPYYFADKLPGAPMDVPDTPRTRELEQQVREINEFLGQFDIRGGAHRGYRRHFNNGDDKGFDFNKGGRLYSYGTETYQNMSPREKRLEMTIDGEPVCELDIRACNLTTLLAWHGQHHTPGSDPYEVRGLPEGPGTRAAVKRFVNATFGSKKPLSRWPTSLVEEHHEDFGENLSKQHPLRKIREAVFESIPLLAAWETDPRDWSDLMFVESTVVVRSMLDLKALGVPSLAMHDSLIVPASKADIATTTLEKHYRAVTGSTPTVTLKGSAVSRG